MLQSSLKRTHIYYFLYHVKKSYFVALACMADCDFYTAISNVGQEDDDVHMRGICCEDIIKYDSTYGTIKYEIPLRDVLVDKLMKGRLREAVKSTVPALTATSLDAPLIDATAKVEVSRKKKTKNPSKFAQLMAGEHIPILESASSTSLEELLNGFEKEQEKNHINKFKLEWTKTGILSTLPESAPNSDKPPSIYTCTLPDDDIALSTDLGELIESGGVQMQEPELHNRREMHYIPSLLTQNQVQSLLDVITAHIDYQEAQA